MQSAFHVETGNGSLRSDRTPITGRPSHIATLDQTIIDAILKINQAESEQYIQDEPERRRFQALYPTKFLFIVCMDGRTLPRALTKTKAGITIQVRSIGAACRPFWPAFMTRVTNEVSAAIAMGVRLVIYVTYHFSASDTHLGCAGCQFDTARARRQAERLASDLDEIYGDAIIPIVTGIETDSEAIILHGPGGDLSGADLIQLGDEEVASKIRRAFPTMDAQSLHDLTPLMAGNGERVNELRQTTRDLHALDHCERILAVGQGFEWLAQSNLALIINDFDPNLDHAISVAGSILEKNLKRDGSHHDFAIFTNVEYHKRGIDHRQARSRARGLMEFAREHLIDRCPRLWNSGRLMTLSGVTCHEDKRLEVLEHGGPVGIAI